MGATRLKESMEKIGSHKPLTREEMRDLARDQAKRVVAYTQKLNAMPDQPDMSPTEYRRFFQHRYREIAKTDLVLDEENMDVIAFMLLYFTGNPLIERYSETFKFRGGPQRMSLDKGIMILGSPGTGKTSLFQAFSYNYRNPFSVVSCLDIASKFAKGGYEEIDQYMKVNKNPSVRPFGISELGWMFDDLGYEKETKHYGDQSLIMEEILFSHSNNPDSKGKIHVSSNLLVNEIDERYGDRIASRINQMFNVIYYKTTKDRRR